MKSQTVLVIGSLHPPRHTTPPPGLGRSAKRDFDDAAQKSFDDQWPRFEAACKALGAAFARRHWRIMVGTPEWEYLADGHIVASHVVQGASSEPADEKTGAHRVIFYAPRDTEPPDKTSGVPDTLGELRRLPNIALEHKFMPKGEYKAKVIPNIADVDAVLLVAGGEGTASIGYAAYSLQRPVIAVAGLGGAAKALYDDVLSDTYDRYKDAAGVSDTEERSLLATWNPDARDAANRGTADAVVNATEKIVKAWGQSGRRTTRVLGWSMVGMAALLALWVYVYLAVALVPAPSNVASPPPRAAASQPSRAAASQPSGAAASQPSRGIAVSTGEVSTPSSPTLRANGPSAFTDSAETAVRQPRRLAAAFFLLLYISAAVGTGLRVLVAYESSEIARLTPFAVLVELIIALSVAFGLGLFYLIGGISFTGQVVALVPNAQTFGPIAVSMSVLGLAAGYLVPLDKLRDRLQKIFAEESK